ncbi:response regulator [Congregibacter variabilis]|uniref:Response regulator n=1 Tax=Congregibacter variabilis TaxID=3081200 RepID=A0ABZ0I2K0_9GAMM|nr:response regulator [Congregibacter sp. IMCC43200]
MTTVSEGLLARKFLDAAPDAMIVVDQLGKIVLCNQQIEALFAYSRDELINQPLDILLPKRFRDDHLKRRQHYAHAATRKVMGIGLNPYGRRKDGLELPIEITLSPVQSDEGSFVIAVIREATLKKSSLFDKPPTDNLSVTLENAEATDNTHHRAGTTACTSTNGNSPALASASDDLRRPLNSLDSCLSAITRELTDPQLLSLTDEMQRSVSTLGALVDSLDSQSQQYQDSDERHEESIIKDSGNTVNAPTILLIDDDPAIVDATTMLFESIGSKVHSARCGDDAMAQLDAGARPDILLFDYQLPGDNGVELIKRVRRITDSQLPSILLTGDTTGDEIRAANLCNCAILTKPIDPEQLLALARNPENI